jgi:hypothetical protein
MKEFLMLRALLCSLALCAFLAGNLRADDQKNKNNKNNNDQNKNTTAQSDQNKQKCEARITKVDPKNRTVTVHMKDKNGKDVDRTFTLTEDVRMVDDTGRIAALDVFQSGNDVLIVEGEGRLKEMHKKATGASPNNRNDKSKNK